MKTIKVFISQPMYGLTLEKVLEERNQIIEEFKKFAIDSKIMSSDEGDTILDVNLNFNDTVNYKGRMWYLGRSIQAMEEADFIIFSKDWTSAHGCRVEYEAAVQYFNCHVAPNPESNRFCSCDILADGSPVHGKLTCMIDEIFFDRSY